MRSTRLAISAALAVLGATSPMVALAHAGLVSSSPAPDDTLATPPNGVTLVFDGELGSDGTGFTVTDLEGVVVGEGELDLAVAERNQVRGPVEITQPGTYSVAWTVVAADGHEEEGDFVFLISAAAEQPDTAFSPAVPDVLPTLGLTLLVLAVAICVWRVRRVGLIFGLLLAVAIAGCTGGDPDCAALPTRIELDLTADRLTPASPAVCRGREVTLVVTSEVDGVFHIHGYDDEVPATTVTAGEVTELFFTAGRSGQFPIELHTDENTVGVALGVFTVHEP